MKREHDYSGRSDVVQCFFFHDKASFIIEKLWVAYMGKKDGKRKEEECRETFLCAALRELWREIIDKLSRGHKSLRNIGILIL